jgi:hypothetical protein
LVSAPLRDHRGDPDGHCLFRRCARASERLSGPLDFKN